LDRSRCERSGYNAVGVALGEWTIASGLDSRSSRGRSRVPTAEFGLIIVSSRCTRRSDPPCGTRDSR
jgi:hypothetical protein